MTLNFYNLQPKEWWHMRSVLPFVISHPLFPFLLRNLQLTLVLLLPGKKVT